jgi:hypothetical protein
LEFSAIFSSSFCQVVPQKVDFFHRTKNPEKAEFLMIFLNAVHRVVFGWPALDHMFLLENIPKNCSDLAS